MNNHGIRRCALALAVLAAVPAEAAKLKQTISFAQPPNRTFGSVPTPLSATASSGLAVTFASRTPSICTVAGSSATPVAVGKCTVRASQAGNATWGAAPNVDRSFTIAKGAQTISFAPLADRALDAAPFTVSATASSGLAVSFASLAPGVCAVAGGVVSLRTVGTCVVRASQAGNANYLAAPSVDRSFAVSARGIRYSYDAAGNLVGIHRSP